MVTIWGEGCWVFEWFRNDVTLLTPSLLRLSQPQKTGFNNIGNTCYINAVLSAVRCIRCGDKGHKTGVHYIAHIVGTTRGLR